MTDNFYIDFHTHNFSGKNHHIYNIDFCRAEQITQIMANPSAHFSIGLHPWSLTNLDNNTDIWARLATLAEAKNIIAIGETGLDKYYENQTSAARQLDIFARHIDLAERLQKPLILHVVGKYNEALQIISTRKNRVPIALHGFNKRPEVGIMFWRHNVYTSFGAAIFDNKSTQNSLIACPKNLLFLETDAQTKYNISDIYAHAAECLSISVADLSAQIQINFNRFFSKYIFTSHV